MAKVTAPLFGLEASGSLSESIVYSRWKGIAYARRYVIPANPNTAAQQTQRAFLEDAVTEWHDVGYTAADVTSLNRWASYTRSGLSGFNKHCSEYVLTRVAGNAWGRPYNLLVTANAGGSITFTFKVNGDDATLTTSHLMGASQGFMPSYGAYTWSVPNLRYEKTIAGFTPGARFFWRIQCAKAGVYGTLGNGLVVVA